MVDVFQRATAAAASERGRAVGAKKRAVRRRDTKLGPNVRGPLVFKFWLGEDWAFIIARSRKEARLDARVPKGETVYLPTVEDLTRMSVALIRARGDCIRVPRYKTNGREE